MADVSYTASQVLASDSAPYKEGICGETIAAGDWLYLKASDSRLWKADASTADKAAVVGCALNGGAAGQPVRYHSGNDLTLAGMTAGSVYCVSDTAGKIRPVADAGTGDFMTIVGGAKSATNLSVQIHALGVAVP